MNSDAINIGAHIITGLMGFMGLVIWGFFRSLPERVTKMEALMRPPAEINALSDRILKLEMRFENIMNTIRAEIGTVIHSPHTPIIDALIEKFDSGQMSQEEIIEFERLLRCMKSDTTVSKGLKTACSLMIVVVLDHKHKNGKTHEKVN